jgi:hypothetical protein
MKMNDNITAILKDTTTSSEGFAALKAAGEKPWQGTGMHPHTWMKQAQFQLQGGASQDITTGFADGVPTVVTTTTPEEIVSKMQTSKEEIEEIFFETGKDIKDMFAQAKRTFNPSIIEVVVNATDKEIDNLVDEFPGQDDLVIHNTDAGEILVHKGLLSFGIFMEDDMVVMGDTVVEPSTMEAYMEGKAQDFENETKVLAEKEVANKKAMAQKVEKVRKELKVEEEEAEMTEAKYEHMLISLSLEDAVKLEYDRLVRNLDEFNSMMVMNVANTRVKKVKKAYLRQVKAERAAKAAKAAEPFNTPRLVG